jgi:site-specific DNA recombinase
VKAFIYVRVSTALQAKEGISMDAQEAKARAWAEANGYEVAAVFTDAGISGKRMKNRPGLQAALAAATSNRGSALISYSLSRIARSLPDALHISERLEKAGADLVSLTERIDTSSASGKMIFRILAVLAEFERDITSERIKETAKHKKSRGERFGQLPFGKRLELGRLIDDPQELALLEQMRQLKESGWSWQRIADHFNEQGILTKKGRRWSWANCRKIDLAAKRSAA